MRCVGYEVGRVCCGKGMKREVYEMRINGMMREGYEEGMA